MYKCPEAFSIDYTWNPSRVGFLTTRPLRVLAAMLAVSVVSSAFAVPEVVSWVIGSVVFVAVAAGISASGMAGSSSMSSSLSSIIADFRRNCLFLI